MAAAAASPLPTIPSLAPETPTPVPTHPGPPTRPAARESQPEPLPAGETRTVTLETDKGDIVIEVEADLSPIAAGNFVALADCGFYDNVIFHRVVPDFVIQGGDGQFGRAPDWIPGMAGTGGPGYTIEDEPVTAKYGRGTVAWARTARQTASARSSSSSPTIGPRAPSRATTRTRSSARSSRAWTSSTPSPRPRPVVETAGRTRWSSRRPPSATP